MYLPEWQIHVSKTVLHIPRCIFASNATQRELPPAQLCKKYFPTVIATDKYSGVAALAKWNVYGHHMRIQCQFLTQVFALAPNTEQYRNVFFGILVDCQDINRINGIQFYFTVSVSMIILVYARRDYYCCQPLVDTIQNSPNASHSLIAYILRWLRGDENPGSSFMHCEPGCQCY